MPAKILVAGDQSHSDRYVWYVIGLLSVVNVFNYMDRMALAVLAPLIKVDLQLTDGQLGLLIGFAFALFYAICGIPIARWADRGVRRNIIATALATWSVMTALCGAAHNFWQLLAARVGVGAGEAGCIPPGQSILCDYVPLAQRPGMFAVQNFGLFVGMMLGMAVTGAIGEVIGWRWAFVILGLPGIALAVIVRLTLREPQRGACDAVQDDGTPLSFGEALRFLWRCRTYRLLVVFAVSTNFVQFGLSQWWPAFFTRLFGLSLSSMGVSLGIALGVGQGIGLLLGGLLANKVGQRDPTRPLLLGVATIALALPAAVASLFVASATVSILMVALTGLLWSVPNGSVLATLYSVAGAKVRATAGAVAIFLISVLGIGLGPLCVGVLSDVLSSTLGVEGLRYALLAPIGLLPVVATALYAAAKALPNDLSPEGTSGEEVASQSPPIDSSSSGLPATR